MGLFEEGIVRSMSALRDAEPDAARFMFVFPLSLMNGVADGLERTHPHAKDGDVALFARPPETAEPPARADAPSWEPVAAPAEDDAEDRLLAFQELRDAGRFLRAYRNALLLETRRARAAAARARREGEERRERTGFEPFPLRTSGLAPAEVVEEARRMREASRRLREEAEERRAQSADDPLALPPS